MISRHFQIVGLILFTLFPHFSRAEPSFCEYQHYLEWTQKYFDSADAVFTGTVISEETPKPPAGAGNSTDPVSSMDELLKRIQAAQSRAPSPEIFQNVTLRVGQSWKYLRGPKITVKAHLRTEDTGTRALFSIGTTYLVFAYKTDEEKILHVPVGCASPDSWEETASRIRVLNALTKKPVSQ